MDYGRETFLLRIGDASMVPRFEVGDWLGFFGLDAPLYDLA